MFSIDPSLVITRDEAFALVPDLVKFTELPLRDSTDLWEKINAIAVRNYADSSKTFYVRAKVSNITRDWRNEDGPVIRVKAGEISWRVDGSDHFLPV